MNKSFNTFLLSGLSVILIVIIIFYIPNEVKAQKQSQSINTLLKGFIGQSFQVDYGDRNRGEFTLTEVNLDYLVLEKRQDEVKARVIYPINAIASVVCIQKSPTEKEILFRLRLFNPEEINGHL
jgi:hypothetical protein